jgi:hypothetical protein
MDLILVKPIQVYQAIIHLILIEKLSLIHEPTHGHEWFVETCILTYFP